MCVCVNERVSKKGKEGGRDQLEPFGPPFGYFEGFFIKFFGGVFDQKYSKLIFVRLGLSNNQVTESKALRFTFKVYCTDTQRVVMQDDK